MDRESIVELLRQTANEIESGEKDVAGLNLKHTTWGVSSIEVEMMPGRKSDIIPKDNPNLLSDKNK